MTRRSAADEGGAILVLSAVMMPLFLLILALVVDVGDWYTHKRQLQNRADAAAFAAGVEYARNWKACVQTGDAALKFSTAREIANAARQYAADPEAADYSPDPLPTQLYNAEIANQTKLDVIINSDSSNNYTDDTDLTDGGAGNVATPCFNHTGDPEGISPGGGQWTDVKVKERELPSLFGSIGLPLSRNIARARIEIRPALSGHRFLPLAIPNNVIEKVQVRYYNECTSPPTQIGPAHDLKPLPAADQTAFASAGGGTLWGLPGADPNVGDGSAFFALTLPSYSPSCGDYVPVGVEVRLASTDIDLNQSCAALITARFADCFHRRSQIRVWNDGNADSQIRIPRVALTGGCGSPADGYFGPVPVAAVNCRYDVTVDVNWGTRSKDERNVPANFTVSANSTNVPLIAWVSGGVSTYATVGGAITATPGANPVTITASWEDTDKDHDWGGSDCKSGNGNPCKASVNDGHQAFTGTSATAGAVALIRTSQSPLAGGVPGAPFDNHRSGGGPSDCTDSDTCIVYPTVGTKSVLKTGAFTTLRLDDPQANQTLRCDPAFAQGQEFNAFQFGCQPWYGVNPFTAGPWWDTANKLCPDDGQWFSYNDLGQGFGVNSTTNPWRCVLTAPGMSTGQVGDDIAVATGNCDSINNNSCQSFDCNYDGNYDGKAISSVQPWILSGDSAYRRVVSLFIVPYQGSKGLTGAGDEIPVIGFASFYVMNWTGANNNQSDPCPDRTWGADHDPRPTQGSDHGRLRGSRRLRARSR